MPRLADVDEIIKKISGESMAKHIPEYCLLQTDEKCRLALHGQIIKQFLLDAPAIELPQWIPVTERLPEPFVSVLGYCPDEDPLPAVHECYINGFGQWTSSVVYGMGNVTHWMEMPKPPEDGENTMDIS